MSHKIAFASHVATIDGKQYDGIGDALKESLSEVTSEYIFVRHSMDGFIDSEVQYHKNGQVLGTHKLAVVKKPSPMRYISELLATIWYFSFHESVDIYLGIDPLNALAGILLKRLRKVRKAVFYTADYSPSRFGNKIMDNIYHRIDRFCVKHADEVWSVSSRIVKIRKDMGLPDQKNILVPNVPPSRYKNIRKDKHNIHELITLGIIDKQLDFEGVIKALSILKKDYPDVSFTIIGNGPDEKRLKKLAYKLNLAETVHFLGRLPFGEAQERVSSAGVGLALYTGIWGFNEFGDSTKCREFFTYGLPVLSTDTHSTVEDIKKYEAGLVVGRSEKEYANAISRLFTNYKSYSKNALLVASQYEGAREKALRRLM